MHLEQPRHQPRTAHATTNTIMQLEQHISSYVLSMPPPPQPCSSSNLSPAMYCACHHQHNHAAGATYHQLCAVRSTTKTTMQLDQPITKHVQPMPSPTQPCSWSNLAPAMYCPCHHKHNHAAGVTSHELYTAYNTTSTHMQLEQPRTRRVLPISLPTRPCSWSNLPSAMYCTCNH
jgi:hypothetical protein